MGGVLEAHRQQCRQGFGVFLDTRENQIAFRRRQVRFAFKQAGIMALYIFQHLGQMAAKVAGAVMTHEAGDVGQAGLVTRHRMGLLVFHHLQTVFQHAQIAVIALELFAHLRFHPPLVHQRIQRALGRWHAQAGVPATENKLLGLGKELDLADTAFA